MKVLNYCYLITFLLLSSCSSFKSNNGEKSNINSEILKNQSINKVIINIPNETQIYSGHGPSTLLSEEKKHNPFLK